MIEKTRGILLHQIKYSDSGLIALTYTKKFGRVPIMIRGLRNKKSGRHNVFFQPMFILDMVLYYKEPRSVQTLKEFSVSFTPSDIHSDIRKSSVAIFLGEVLNSVLKEETPNEELFNFIEESIIYFDKTKDHFSNFHIAFLAGLSSYLGFEPVSGGDKPDKYFDMLNGEFVSSPPGHGNYAGIEISAILAEFFRSSFDQSCQISLTGSLRNELLGTLVKYYSLHLPGLEKIKSLDVLKEVFG